MAVAPLSPLCSTYLPKRILILGFRRPATSLTVPASAVGPNFSPMPLSLLRFNYAVKLQRRRVFATVYASNTDPSNEGSVDETSNEIKDGQGPPFLTILAGFVVLFLVGWIVWSILIWLIGVIVNWFPSK